MRVIFAASEANPFIKSGGLGDVVGALPKELVKNEVEAIVIIPLYQDINRENLEYVTDFDIFVGWNKCYCGVYKAIVGDVTYYFVDNEQYFKRSGLYGYGDDYERFAYFDFAVLEIISHLNIKPDILHLHDWQAAMIAMLYKERYQYYDFYEDIKIVFTIHNILYQGIGDPSLLGQLFGLDDNLYFNGNCQNNGKFNMMKAAIYYSDLITTVSDTYSKEILTDEFGEGLQNILRMRRHDLYGVLNGIDYDEFNPKTDPNLFKNYDVKTVSSNKYKNKLSLQKELGLTEDKDILMMGLVTRLTNQKGISLILNEIDKLAYCNLQFVILGAGDSELENALVEKANLYPNKIKLLLKYDFKMSCKIYGACDLFLMPSLFEPCGLTQMIAMRYGTIPLVREVGGLKDSVEPYNEYTNQGTGFSFTNYNSYEMMEIIRYALDVYYQSPNRWKQIRKRAMLCNLDWQVSAKKYLMLYQSLF